MSFHLNVATKEYHPVRPKQFLGLWYIWRKLCTNLCTETNTISKRTETSFHLSLVTQEYNPVHQKHFLSLWYIWRKPSPIMHRNKHYL
jgi:hypothetical protein